MNNILISGAPGTGKSIISTALSYMIGFPIVRNRPSSEVVYELNLNSDISSHSFKELFTIGFSNFVDRLQLEYRYPEGFISDGSIINDIVTMKLYLNTQASQTNPFFNWIPNKTYIKECNKMIHSLERIAREYARYQYGTVVHLAPSHKVKSEIERDYLKKFNEELLGFYHSANINFSEYNGSNFGDVVEKLISEKKYKVYLSTSSALFKTFSDMHIDTVDNMFVNPLFPGNN